MTVVLYVAAIVAANIITAGTTPLDVGPLLIPWGTWLIGATFVLRDLVQLRHGRHGAYAAIGVALAASALTSAALGDTLAIVVASALAFAVSESADTEVFTRMRGRLPKRVAASGTVGALLDSVIFAVVGLSPVWSGIVPWDALPQVIAGQLVVKVALQFIAAGAWHALDPRSRRAEAAA